METLRRCAKCKTEKPITNFGSARGRPKSYCRPCEAQRAREWLAKNKDRVNLKRNKQEREARRYANAVRNKQCFDCGSPTNGSIYCSEHRAIRAEKERDRRAANTRICPACNVVEMGPRQRMCPACADPRGERFKRRQKEWNQRYHSEVMSHYGGAVCACCGEKEFLFLTIDHIDGKGNEHRRSISHNGEARAARIYYWLKRNNYPAGFQVLCYNCNCGKFRNGGICPHQQQKELTDAMSRLQERI